MGSVFEQLAPVLETDFPGRMAELGIPGAALALIEGGELKAVRCFGFADIDRQRPVTPGTLFSLQSISKSVAAWAVMRLVEEGRLDLDRPISDYLTSWTFPPAREADAQLVTARRLLTHHAGISTAGFRGIEYRHDTVGLLEAMRAELPPPTEEQVLYYRRWNLPEDQPVHIACPPGEAWHYSNPGFAILEIAVQDITGLAFADYVTSSILLPLKMSRATFAPDFSGDVAVPHGAHQTRLMNYRNVSGAAAGLFASIEDLAIFTMSSIEHANGRFGPHPVLSPAAVAEMYRGYGAADQSTGVPFEAGLGHLVLGAGGLRNVHHSGGAIGWRSIWSAYPEIGSGICILMNSDQANELWIPFVRQWREAVMAFHG